MSNNTNINNHYKSVVNEIKKKYGNSSITNNNASSLNNNSNTNDSNINKIAVKIKNHLR